MLMIRKGMAIWLALTIGFSLAVIIVDISVPTEASIIYVGGSGPGNHSSIQDGIDAANPGDTVFVYNGTYRENIIINKTINLIGEDKNKTIIDGIGNRDIVRIKADWVNVSGFKLNDADPDYEGFDISSDNNNISGNILSLGSWADINIFGRNNTLIGNTMARNGIYIQGIEMEYLNSHTIPTSNTVDGKPIYYLKNLIGYTVPAGAGQVILVNCTQVTVTEQEIDDTAVAIQILNSSNNHIMENDFKRNTYGIELWNSHGNEVSNNSLYYNKAGISISDSNENNITNNMINRGGMSLGGANNNNIINNIINDDYDSFYISYSTGNYINGNSIHSDFQTALTIGVNATDNIISQNHIYDNEEGVYVWSGGNVFSQNNFSNNEYGIWILWCNATTFDGNTFNNNEHGFFFIDSYFNNITNNDFSSNGNAINIDDLSDYLVSGNTFSNNRNGVSISNSNNIAVIDNEFMNNDYGLQMVGDSNGNMVNNNTFNGNYWGMALWGTSNISIEGNEISQNNDGIHLEWASNNIIRFNNISNNEYGMYLDDWCVDNIIEDNIYVDNNDHMHEGDIDNSGLVSDSESNELDLGILGIVLILLIILTFLIMIVVVHFSKKRKKSNPPP
jgi:parallel beta-helix repeat protein